MLFEVVTIDLHYMTVLLSCHSRILLSLIVCEVEQDNVPPVLLFRSLIHRHLGLGVERGFFTAG